MNLGKNISLIRLFEGRVKLLKSPAEVTAHWRIYFQVQSVVVDRLLYQIIHQSREAGFALYRRKSFP